MAKPSAASSHNKPKEETKACTISDLRRPVHCGTSSRKVMKTPGNSKSKRMQQMNKSYFCKGVNLNTCLQTTLQLLKTGVFSDISKYFSGGNDIGNSLKTKYNKPYEILVFQQENSKYNFLQGSFIGMYLERGQYFKPHLYKGQGCLKYHL